ncbi:Ankyrin repeat domain-containing protein 50 [Trichoderma lentiforme]|uniref:protein S-acyltransferase n=1 Tax=Trichoderma lentiforme TaxID=1567552 RepID=A0A9P4X5D3_9HYPO|nr:Ankyrin repeat domain-containing protein 50 [Trichoderma lentiforme]
MNFSWLSQWFRQEKNTVVDNQHPPTSEQTSKPKRELTFRIRGVPNDWDRVTLQSFLTEGDRIGDPVIKSLAKEFHGRSQTATVDFRSDCQLPSKFSLPTDSSQHVEPHSLVLDHDFLNITSLFTPSQKGHKVDIIAISGLGGHAFGSFKERGGEHMWLRDALPHVITSDSGEQIARIMVYGYESSLPNSDSFQNLEDLGTSLHSDLRALTSYGSFKPIVFIAHSLGGLIVKQFLISLSKPVDDVDQRLRGAIYGIAFFGVPHDGMDIRSLTPMAGDGPNRFLLESIGFTNSQILSIQQREFSEALSVKGEVEIISFYETRLSPTALQVWLHRLVEVDSANAQQDNKSGKWTMLGEPAVLVSKASATHCRPWEDGPEHICAINRTHSEMVKFSQEDSEYEKVLGRIKSLTRRAIKTRRKQIPPPHLSPEEQNCLHSLAFRQMQDRDNDIEHAVQGTCEWLLKHETYINWATSNKSLLWIKGKPGAGKSTLLKYALGKQRDILSAGGNNLVMSFFFHARGDDLQKTPLGFLRSILHQILKQTPEALFDLVSAYQQKCRDMGDPGGKWQWHSGELWDFFKSCLPRILTHQSIWLFVDALDECGENHAKDIVQRLTWLLEKLPPHPAWTHIHICFTCRHYPILSSRGLLEIWLEMENKNDISTYVQSELKLSSFEEPIPSGIQNLIIARASGVFLWARLVAHQARDLELNGAGSNKIEKTIRSIPEGLHELYKELIRGMGPSSLRLIQWVCCSMRPLSTEELRWAMVIDARFSTLQECQKSENYIPDSRRMNQRLINLSRGLIEVTPGPGAEIVQFNHQSVKDFFMTEGLGILDTTSASADESVGMAHLELLKTCICYLKMEEISRSTSIEDDYRRTPEFPFLQYATTSWIPHLQQSDDKRVGQGDILKLLSWPSNILVEFWTRIFHYVDGYSNYCPSEGTTLVHITAKYRMIATLTAILESRSETNININSKDSHGRTPLLWATEKGHEAAVKLLLDAGAEVNSKDNNRRTPLSWAAKNGHKAVVRILLSEGAEVDSKGVTEKTPLSLAAEYGHGDIAQLLLGAGAQVDSKDRNGQTPLSWAAKRGHEAVVRILLSEEALFDEKDNNGRTPLSWAAQNGPKAVVRILLSEGAEVDSKDEHGRTPLSWAAGAGQAAVVRLLLDAGAQVDLRDTTYRETPLLWAAKGKHGAVIKRLLDAGAEVDLKATCIVIGRLWTSTGVHEALLNKLMLGQPALLQAAKEGHEAVVKMLLSTGAVFWFADICAIDGRVAMVAAVDAGHSIVARYGRLAGVPFCDELGPVD